MIDVSFTGTKKGMTAPQLDQFKQLIQKLDIVRFSHGCCIGADRQAHVAVRDFFSHGVRIEGRPCDILDKQDIPVDLDEIYPAKPPLKRNKHLVKACDVLIATPKGDMIVRSGTWSTVRYAQKLKKHVYIIYPGGELEYV